VIASSLLSARKTAERGHAPVADAIAGFETGQDLKAIAGAVPCSACCGSELGEGEVLIAAVKQDCRLLWRFCGKTFVRAAGRGAARGS
jgi:hypothetical protein